MARGLYYIQVMPLPAERDTMPAGAARGKGRGRPNLRARVLKMSVLPHNVNRIVLDADCTFEELRDRYEALVPANERATSLISQGKSWADIVADVKAASPYAFFIFWKMDAMAAFRFAGHTGGCTEYLMGNFTVAERMYRHDPSIMLYAPLRTLIYTTPDGKTHFAIDQPASIFSGFSNPDIAAVGVELDNKTTALLRALDLRVPALASW